MPPLADDPDQGYIVVARGLYNNMDKLFELLSVTYGRRK
jgi:hypothetical protein